MINQKLSKTIFVLLLTSGSLIFAKQEKPFSAIKNEPQTEQPQEKISEIELPQIKLPIIKTIVVQGNNYIRTDAILNRLPYKIGTPFDCDKSGVALNHLYALGYFSQVALEKELTTNPDEINLYITVQEKKTPRKHKHCWK